MTAPSCPDGFSPDFLFRVQFPPYFNEPYGEDCYFNANGYAMFGGIVLALNIIALVLHGMVLTEPHTKLIYSVVTLQTVLVISNCVTIIIGFVHPKGFAVAWTIFIALLGFVGFAWGYMGYETLVRTIQKVEPKRASLSELMGGRITAMVSICLALAAAITSGVGCSGVVVSLFAEPVDNERATIYYRIFCVSLATFVFLFIVSAARILTRFVTMVESAIGNVAEHLVIDSNQGSADARIEGMKDIATRFKRLRVILIGAAPLGVGAWVVQTAILPLFWYLVLLHFLNVWAACMGMLNSVVSVERKRSIRRKLRRLVGYATTTSAGTAHVKQSAGDVDHSKILSNHQVKAVEAFSSHKEGS